MACGIGSAVKAFLYVDTDGLSQRLIRRYCEVCGWRMTSVTSFDEAIEQCRTTCFDALFLDVPISNPLNGSVIGELVAAAVGQPGVVLVTVDKRLVQNLGLTEGPAPAVLEKPVSLAAFREAIAMLETRAERSVGDQASKASSNGNCDSSS